MPSQWGDEARGVIENLNLGLRFILELLALAAIGYGGFHLTSHPAGRWLLAIGLVVGFAFAWGAFRVTGDGGPPLVETPPRLRLALEFVVFGAAVLLLAVAGRPRLALIFGVVVVVHYAIGYARTLAFLAGRGPN
jgi:hypothetical protein